MSDAIELLKAREAGMSGADMKSILLSLGFEVRPGSNGKHQIVTHDHIEGFMSTSFDEGHNKHMLPTYPRSIRRVLKQYQTELEIFLGDRDGKS